MIKLNSIDNRIKLYDQNNIKIFLVYNQELEHGTISKRIKELIDCIDKSNFSKLPRDVPLKPQVFKYLNNHPSAKVKEIINLFKEEDEATILRYCQEWRIKRRVK